jgi:hypothetical protein
VFVVSLTGADTGSDSNGRSYTGTIAPKSTGLNAYTVSLVIANCAAANNTYTGSAVEYAAVAYGDRRGLAAH